LAIRKIITEYVLPRIRKIKARKTRRTIKLEPKVVMSWQKQTVRLDNPFKTAQMLPLEEEKDNEPP
jgi:hypothetical protein